MSRVLVALALVSILSACGGGGGGGSKIEIPPYPIISLWAEGDGCRNLHFQEKTGVPKMEMDKPYNLNIYHNRYLNNLAQCNVDYTLSGTDKAGSYTISNSTWVEGSSASDPGCNAMNTTGHYYLHKPSVPFIMYMQPATGEAIQYHWCSWDVESQSSTCIPKVCGIL